MAVVTNPGHVPEEWHLSKEELDEIGAGNYSKLLKQAEERAKLQEEEEEKKDQLDEEEAKSQEQQVAARDGSRNLNTERRQTVCCELLKVFVCEKSLRFLPADY